MGLCQRLKCFFKYVSLFLPSVTHLMKKINRFPFRCLVLQIASIPLQTVFNSISRKMAKKEGGANHRNTFPHCH